MAAAPKAPRATEITWRLLLPDERAFLDEIGAVMHESGFEFTRSITWEQFTTAFSHVMGLKRRSPRRGTHINFAIGDCLIAGETYFGRPRVNKWLREFLNTLRLRDSAVLAAGSLLIATQHVEDAMRLCCAALPSTPQVSVADFLSDDPSKRKHTLGKLWRYLAAAQVFKVEFEQRLGRFVRMRNEFVHHLWVDAARHAGETGPVPSIDECGYVMSRLGEYAVEVEYFREVFAGFRRHVLQGTPWTQTPETSMTPAVVWTRYMARFDDAVRPGQRNSLP